MTRYSHCAPLMLSPHELLVGVKHVMLPADFFSGRAPDSAVLSPDLRRWFAAVCTIRPEMEVLHIVKFPE